ncbi:sulfotransferase [Algoriphagus sp. SE2]|uniref:sulfotransferase family protein n=1 Tax=Algoriphagus sp. SE2 TaxID=3141536 RepID=UPI0031CD9709
MSHQSPIFLISLPRSGSTLLQRIISNHPDIATTSEPWMALPLFYKNLFDNLEIKKDLPYSGNTSQVAITEFLSNFKNSNFTLKRNLAIFYSLLCSDLAKEKGKVYFLDKTPRYYYILDELIDYFPNSKFIILHRNPFAILNSILKTWVKKNPFFLGYYKDDLTIGYKTLEESRKIVNSNLYHVEYDEIIKNTELELKNLCNFLGVNYFSDMSNLVIKDKFKLGDPVNAFSKTGIDKDLKEDWKTINNVQSFRFYKDYFDYLKNNGYAINHTFNSYFKSHNYPFYKFRTISMDFVFHDKLRRFSIPISKIARKYKFFIL